MRDGYRRALRAKARQLPHSRFLPLRFSLYLEPLRPRDSSLRRPSPATWWSGWWAYRALQAAKSKRKGSEGTAEEKGEMQTHRDTGQQQGSCYPCSARATSRWQTI